MSFGASYDIEDYINEYSDFVSDLNIYYDKEFEVTESTFHNYRESNKFIWKNYCLQLVQNHRKEFGDLIREWKTNRNHLMTVVKKISCIDSQRNNSKNKQNIHQIDEKYTKRAKTMIERHRYEYNHLVEHLKTIIEHSHLEEGLIRNKIESKKLVLSADKLSDTLVSAIRIRNPNSSVEQIIEQFTNIA